MPDNEGQPSLQRVQFATRAMSQMNNFADKLALTLRKKSCLMPKQIKCKAQKSLENRRDPRAIA
ncbi:MAG: hypothetical protein R8G34_00565 [Paracoccaceae bacterium]|nr:hypothetical protein [Paracoccaceae bacterium]